MRLTLTSLFLIAPTMAFAQSGADLLDRIQRLEAQNRTLTGHVEQLQHQTRDLETRLKRMGDDNELRFQDIEKKAGGANSRANAPTPMPARPAPSQTSGAQSIGSLAEQANKQPASGLSNDPKAGNLSGLVQKSPREEFQEAKALSDKRKFDQAEASLRIFLEKHPKDANAGDATYFLGDTLYQRKRYKEAAQYFLTVSTDHTRASRAPNALLRLGQSLNKLGERESACSAYGELSRKYPAMAPQIKKAMDSEVASAKCL